jgi:hypothetical protein
LDEALPKGKDEEVCISFGHGYHVTYWHVLSLSYYAYSSRNSNLYDRCLLARYVTASFMSRIPLPVAIRTAILLVISMQYHGLLGYWFGSQCLCKSFVPNAPKTCPECRTRLPRAPAPSFLVCSYLCSNFSNCSNLL